MAGGGFFDAEALLVLLEGIEDPDPGKPEGPDKENKSDHEPGDEIRGLLVKVPEMRF